MKITDYKMIQKDGHEHLDLSWKVFKEVIEIETGLKDREIQQKLIEMGWTPPKELKPVRMKDSNLKKGD